MSANLTFDEHIQMITAKARRISEMVLQSFRSRKTAFLLPLLKSLVRSQVEYASPIWSPTKQCLINKLEKIQEDFTSKFQRFRDFDPELSMTICNTSYPERLRLLKIDSLQRRRERYSIIYMEKIKLGLVPNPGIECEYRRTEKFTFKPCFDRKNGRYNFYCIGPSLYNSIPAELREPDDANITAEKHMASFKAGLDKYLRTLRDTPGTQANSLLNQHVPI